MKFSDFSFKLVYAKDLIEVSGNRVKSPSDSQLWKNTTTPAFRSTSS